MKSFEADETEPLIEAQSTFIRYFSFEDDLHHRKSFQQISHAHARMKAEEKCLTSCAPSSFIVTMAFSTRDVACSEVKTVVSRGTVGTHRESD